MGFGRDQFIVEGYTSSEIFTSSNPEVSRRFWNLNKARRYYESLNNIPTIKARSIIRVRKQLFHNDWRTVIRAESSLNE